MDHYNLWPVSENRQTRHALLYGMAMDSNYWHYDNRKIVQNYGRMHFLSKKGKTGYKHEITTVDELFKACN